MAHLGEDIRTARDIYAIINGEQSAWNEVNVNKWMREATKITNELRLNTFQETLKAIRDIPLDILDYDTTT